MFRAFEDMSAVEITLACGGLLFATGLLGAIADMLMGKSGLGVFLNGILIMAGGIFGVMAHSWLAMMRYL